MAGSSSKFFSEKALSFIFIVLACGAQYGERLTHITYSYLSGLLFSDSGLYVYLSREAFPNLLSGRWFDLNIFYPYGSSLAWSDNFILPSFLSYLINSIGTSHPFSFNLVLLIALFLVGHTTLKLAEELGAERWAATVAAVVAVGSHVLRANAGHVQIQFSFFIPLVMLLVLRAITALRRGEVDHKSSFLCGLCITAAFLTTVYFAFFCLIIIFAVAILSLFIIKDNFKNVGKTCFWFALGCLPCIPFVLPYMEVKEVFGGRRMIESVMHAAKPADYVSPMLGFLFPPETSLTLVRESKFAGSFSLMVASLIALGVMLRSVVAPYISCVVAIAFAIGLSVTPSPALFTAFIGASLWFLWWLHAKESSPAVYGGMLLVIIALIALSLSYGLRSPTEWSPYRLLYQFFPGGSALRVAARFSIIWYYVSYVLIGLALTALSTRSIKWIFAVILIVENYTFSMVPVKGIWKPVFDVNQGHAQHLQPNDVAVFLPTLNPMAKIEPGIQFNLEVALRNVRAMLHSADLGIATPQGYSGIRGDLSRDLIVAMKDFPDQKSFEYLKQYVNLKYVFYEGRLLSGSRRRALLEKIQQTNQYNLIFQDAKGNFVLKITAPLSLDTERTLYLPSHFTGKVALTFEATHDAVIEAWYTGDENKKPTEILLSAGERKEVEMNLPDYGGRGGDIVPREIHLKLLSGSGVTLQSRY